MYAVESLQKKWFIGGEHIKDNIFIKLPHNVEFIINKLENKGFDAYVVGGCVRDYILNKVPKDWDITSSARPQQIKEIFKKTIDTGIKHGTVSVLIDKKTYEITTYRLDGKYSDSRHPDKVEFSNLLEEDLKRRDFTINAMAYSNNTGLVDLFDGKRDLACRLVRCVGDAKERFKEDALRILRAIRFLAKLDFNIEEKTKEAIIELAPNLSKISKERISSEFNEIICSDNPQKLKMVFEYGLDKYLTPSFSQIHPDDKNLNAMKKIDKDKILRYLILMANNSEELGVNILKELKSDNKSIKKFQALHKYLYKDIQNDKYEIKKILRDIGIENFMDLLRIKEALFSLDYSELIELKDEILQKKEAYDISMLDITGNELLAMNIKKGPLIGELLNYLLEKVMKYELENEKKIFEKEIKIKLALKF